MHHRDMRFFNNKTIFSIWFFLMVLVIQSLLFSYWEWVLAPKIKSESLAYANLLAESKAASIANIVSDSPKPDINQVSLQLDQIILLKANETQRLFSGVAVTLQQGNVAQVLSRGISDCEICTSIDIPLFSSNFDDILGVVSFYLPPDAFEHYLLEVRNKVYVEALIIFLVALSTWYFQIRFIHRLSKEIEARKQAERSSEQQEKIANEANQSKSLFLASVTHELKTPLNAIIVNSQIIHDETNDSRQLARTVQLIESSKLLRDLIDDVLDLTKLESNKVKLDHTEFNLRSEVGTALRLFDQGIKDKGLTTKLIIEESVPQFVLGDATRFCQVLINLYSNALKFTEVGEISVSMSAEALNNNWVITTAVKDTGIGMNDEQVKKIFRIFSQADENIHRQYGGSGLGLSISLYLTELMGGEIEVESMPEEGSTFTFTAQFNSVAKAPTVPALSVQSSQHYSQFTWPNAAILVAEDIETNRQVLKDLLRHAKVKIDCVENGEQAVNKVMHNHYDLVLMDVQMPIMDGLLATRLIRQDQSRQSLPIVGLSASSNQHDIANMLASGMSTTLSKPIDINAFFDTLVMQLPQQRLKIEPVRQADKTLHESFTLTGVDVQKYAEKLTDVIKLFAIYKTFVKDSQSVLTTLSDHLKALNWEKCCFVCHGLKGVAANVYAWQVEEQVKRLEQDCKNADADRAQQGIEQLSLLLVTLADELNHEEQRIQLGSLPAQECHSEADLHSLFHQVEEAIAKQSFALEDSVDALCAYFKKDEQHKPLVDMINEAAGKFDFETLARLIITLRYKTINS